MTVGSTPQPTDAPRLRVVTWNVLYRDLARRLDRLTEVLARLDAHVVCTQEALADTHHVLAERLGLSSYWVPSGFPPPADEIGCAVASRYPVVEARALGMDAAKPTRSAAAALIDTPLGMVWIISAHLMYTPTAGLGAADPPYGSDSPVPSVAARIDEISALSTTAADLDGDHVLLCGDLNLLPDSPEYRHLAACGWADAWRRRPRLGSRATIVDANPLLDDAEPAHYRRAHQGLAGGPDTFDYTLDYQMLRGETLAATHAWTIGGQRDGYPSDHLGVVVDYTIPPLSRGAAAGPSAAVATAGDEPVETRTVPGPGESPGSG